MAVSTQHPAGQIPQIPFFHLGVEEPFLFDIDICLPPTTEVLLTLTQTRLPTSQMADNRVESNATAERDQSVKTVRPYLPLAIPSSMSVVRDFGLSMG